MVACGCEARAIEFGCNRLRCRRCEPFLRRRRAKAIADRIEAGRVAVAGGLAVLYTIFTVPPARRGAAADPKIWGSWRRRIWRVLRRRFGALFGCERSDPAGEDGQKWHPHMNFLWVQREGFKPFLDVEELRRAWQEVIAAPVANVYTAFAVGESERADRRRAHWYSYMGRTWPDWVGSVKRHVTLRWFGNYPDRPESSHLCAKCGERYQTMRFGTQEAARELVARGIVEVLEEFEARAEELQVQEWLRPAWARKRTWGPQL